jgi:cytochrome c5
MKAQTFISFIGLALASHLVAQEQTPRLGKTITDDQLAIIDQSIYPDGTGLPPGDGGVEQGKAVFRTYCSNCHGEAGRGGAAEELSGGEKALDSPLPDKTIGTYWPYATTLFDFTRRAMPMHAPGVLSNDEVYAVTAYLLYVNGIIKADEHMNAKTLPKVDMPNRNGFIGIDAPIPEYD